MNLDLGGPGPGCSAMRVRRLLAGELSGAERERIEAHVASCGRCARAAEEIRAEGERLRADVPFEEFAARVAERLAVEPARDARRWVRWAAPLAAAASVAVIAGAALRKPPPTDGPLRTKGVASVQLFLQDSKGVRLLGPKERVPQGARLLPALPPTARSEALVVLLEPGESSVVYQGKARPGPLPSAFEWTGAGKARLVVVLSDRPVDPGRVQGGAGAPPGSDVLELELRR